MTEKEAVDKAGMGVPRVRGRLPRNLISPNDEIVDNIFHTYKTACEFFVSNDAFSSDGVDAVEEMQVCELVTIDGCTDPSNFDKSSLAEVDISFLYELHWHKDSEFDDTLADLEWSILRYLAEINGFTGCESDKKVQTQLASAKRSNEGNQVVAISSAPVDEKDLRWETCAFQDIPGTENAICDPIIGSFTVYMKEASTTSDRILIEDGFLNIIKTGMENDIFLFGNITKAVYVGERKAETDSGNVGTPAGPDTPKTDQIEEVPTGTSISPERGISDVGKSVMVGLGSLFLLVLFAVFAKRRRDSKKEEMVIGVSAPDDGSLAEKDMLALASTDNFLVDNEDMPRGRMMTMIPPVEQQQSRNGADGNSVRRQYSDTYDDTYQGPPAKEDDNDDDVHGGSDEDVIERLHTISDIGSNSDDITQYYDDDSQSRQQPPTNNMVYS